MIARYILAALDALQPEKPALASVAANPMQTAFCSALQDVGEREDPMGSNSGEYVEGLRKYVRLPRLAGGEWCGVFGSAHMYRAGIRIKSRSARKLVKMVAKQGRRVYRADLYAGLCGVSLHKRKGGKHVRLWRCEAGEDGRLLIRHVGGNERHQVKSSTHTIKAYLDWDTIMMATIG